MKGDVRTLFRSRKARWATRRTKTAALAQQTEDVLKVRVFQKRGVGGSLAPVAKGGTLSRGLITRCPTKRKAITYEYENSLCREIGNTKAGDKAKKIALRDL